jgi:DDE superfamily endonuclease
MLPLQLIFGGKTKQVVPSGEAAELMQRTGHHLTNTANHWSTLETCKDFVLKILKPWWLMQKLSLRLLEHVKMVWLIDCWSVHISKAFREWLKNEHSNWLCVVFVPANCTSKLQPADVILQRPMKAAFRSNFNMWLCRRLQEQFEAGTLPSDIKLELKIGILREQCCRYLMFFYIVMPTFSMYNCILSQFIYRWLLDAWQQVSTRREMILKGWAACFLGKLHEHEYQLLAMKVVAERALFAGDGEAHTLLSVEPEPQSGDMADPVEDLSLEDTMRACLGQEPLRFGELPDPNIVQEHVAEENAEDENVGDAEGDNGGDVNFRNENDRVESPLEDPKERSGSFVEENTRRTIIIQGVQNVFVENGGPINFNS